MMLNLMRRIVHHPYFLNALAYAAYAATFLALTLCAFLIPGALPIALFIGNVALSTAACCSVLAIGLTTHYRSGLGLAVLGIGIGLTTFIPGAAALMLIPLAGSIIIGAIAAGIAAGIGAALRACFNTPEAARPAPLRIETRTDNETQPVLSHIQILNDLDINPINDFADLPPPTTQNNAYHSDSTDHLYLRNDGVLDCSTDTVSPVFGSASDFYAAYVANPQNDDNADIFTSQENARSPVSW